MDEFWKNFFSSTAANTIPVLLTGLGVLLMVIAGFVYNKYREISQAKIAAEAAQANLATFAESIKNDLKNSADNMKSRLEITALEIKNQTLEMKLGLTELKASSRRLEAELSYQGERQHGIVNGLITLHEAANSKGWSLPPLKIKERVYISRG